MKTLNIMTEDFTLLGELPIFTSLEYTKSHYGIGEFKLTAHPKAPSANQLKPGALVFDPYNPLKMAIIEQVTKDKDTLSVSGLQLKSLVQRRICVPPMNLPRELYRYEAGQWKTIQEGAQILQLMQGDVYEGYTLPDNPVERMVFLNLQEQKSIYNWQDSLKAGQVWADLGQARLRSKYKNFGWDNIIGPAETAIKHFVKNNLISPEDPARAIPNLVMDTDQGRGENLPWQARFDELGQVIHKIGEKTGMGYDIVPDFVEKQYVFKANPGRDYSQGEQKVVFSIRNGNASVVTFKQDEAGSASTAYIGGAGSDENRLILAVNGEITGWMRREMFVDGGSVEDPEMLRLQGQNKLEDKRPSETLTASIIDRGISRYERDYDVGDMVVVVDEEGRTTRTQLLAIKETYERNRPRSLEATFGASPVTLAKAIQQLKGTTIR